MGTKNSRLRKQSNKLVGYMKVPIKILARARDFYVSSLTGCADHSAFYVNSMSLPRSFSAHSSYDTRELVKAASARGLIEETEAELPRSRKSAAVTRSRTVGIGRIDEDRVCEFAENEKAPVRSRMYANAATYSGQRSRSRSILLLPKSHVESS